MAEETTSGPTRADEQAGRYREAMETIRQRTDYSSKALATIGTAAISGIGYAKLADVFPWAGWSWAILALAAGAALMIAAVLSLVLRFAGASESVFTSSGVKETLDRNGIEDAQEKSLVEKVYLEAALKNGADSLAAYEGTGRELEKEAAELKDPEDEKAKALRDRAGRIFGEVQLAQDRAAALLLRRRAHAAVFGSGMALWVIVFIIGWYTIAVAADSLQGEHVDQVALVKACAEARAAKKSVKDKLPGICGTQLAKEETEEEEEAKKAAALAASSSQAAAPSGATSPSGGK